MKIMALIYMWMPYRGGGCKGDRYIIAIGFRSMCTVGVRRCYTFLQYINLSLHRSRFWSLLDWKFYNYYICISNQPKALLTSFLWDLSIVDRLANYHDNNIRLEAFSNVTFIEENKIQNFRNWPFQMSFFSNFLFYTFTHLAMNIALYSTRKR